MPPSTTTFNSWRVRSYILRLPLFTRIVLGVIILVEIIGFQTVWDIRQWGALIPDQLSIFNAYRINTFPFIHTNLLHALLNIVSLTPLMERFESEYGTLTSISLFIGPLTTIPAVVYTIIERGVLRGNTAVMGASLWVFLLLAKESIRTYRANPHLVIASWSIPTWIMPLVLIVTVAVLVPGTSLLGHLCAVGVGYLFGLGYLKFLAPPERPLRWVESKLNLLAILPHYVSVDQKTYGRFGVLPTTGAAGSPSIALGGGQRLGP
ncbi:rhomboid family protein [Plectosphaerella plurivora]|uniref:rhomboid protease n=1 Tax=Plectosphaerella plurivora TaxID=936078 RepID=A0A9P9A5Q4_9PEZI|nr:rhomboid family protein [Plectosphaerella plurivora]